MAVDLVTSPGGFYRRVGRIGGMLNSLNSFRGSADLSLASIVSTGVGINNIQAQYVSAQQQLIDSLYSNRDGYVAAHDAFAFALSSLAENTAITMVDDDTKLNEKTLFFAIQELIAQSVTAGKTVEKPTVSITPAAGGSNSGNATLTGSVLGPDGVQMDYVYAEVVDVKCTSDSQTGNTSVDAESFSVKGETAIASRLSKDWPRGSGINTTATVIGGASADNLVQNGDLEDFATANIPDSFAVLVGTPGTTIFSAGSSDAYKGSNALEFTGNGSELTSIAQTFAANVIAPKTVYAFNCYLKVSSVPAAGVLAIDLVDSTNTVINDDAGTPNTITKSLPAATTSYVALSAYFRTPTVLPSTVKLRIRLSTALTAAVSVFVDDAILVEPFQLYQSGPYYCLFAGSNKSIANKDVYTLTVANNYSSVWQVLLDRLYNMKELGLQFPSSGSPNIDDAWVA